MQVPSMNKITFSVCLACLLLTGAFGGCNEGQTSPRRRALDYLEYHASNETSSNVWTSSVYAEMLERLESNTGNYVLLRWEQIGNALVVYWFGEDADLNEITLRYSSGHTVTVKIQGYEKANLEALNSGEPQYYVISEVNPPEHGAVVGVLIEDD